MAILFDCPECGVQIRVVDEAAGRRGACPSCKAKLIVPEPETAPPEEAVAGEPVAAEEGDGFPVFAPTASEPSLARQVQKKARKSIGMGSLLTPILCLAVLATVGGWYYVTNIPRLNGELEGTPLTNPDPLGGVIPNSEIDLPAEDRKAILADLSESPAELKSSLARVVFRGSPDGLQVELQPGPDARFVRVDPNQDQRLVDYVQKRFEKFDLERRDALGPTVQQFLNEWDHFRNTKGAKSPNLAAYRNSVGLTALAGPLGWRLEAVWGSEKFPCFYEDSQGRLYFLLPKKAKSFIIRGRKVPGERFPGEFTIALTKPESGGGASRIPVESMPQPGSALSKKELPGMSERAGTKSEDDDEQDDKEK